MFEDTDLKGNKSKTLREKLENTDKQQTIAHIIIRTSFKIGEKVAVRNWVAKIVIFYLQTQWFMTIENLSFSGSDFELGSDVLSSF